MGNEHSTEISPSEHNSRSPSPSPSPEPESTMSTPGQRRSSRTKRCTCSLGHESREECEADPQSRRYTGAFPEIVSSSSEDEGLIDAESKPEAKVEAEAEVKMTSEPQRITKRRVTPRRKEQPRAKRTRRTRGQDIEEYEECDCGDGHESLAKCEKEAKEKRIHDTMSIIIGSQAMATVYVGKESLKQGFLVHKELLTLHSEYFHDLLTTNIKTEVKDEDEKKVKDEKIETPVQNLPTLSDAHLTLPSDEESKALATSLRSPSPSEESNASESSSCSTSPGGPDLSEVGHLLEHKPWEIKPQAPLKTKLPLTTPPLAPPAPTLDIVLSPSTTTLHIPTINPTHFAAFLSYLYTNTIVPSLATLQESSTPHPYPVLYLFGYQLRSASFQNYIMEALRRDVQLARGQWPSAEQARFVYDITASFTPLEVGATFGGGSGGGGAVLKRFTASCLAANSPFERYADGTSPHDGWTKLFCEKPEISLDVLRAQSSRWHEQKPWDDAARREWMVEEKRLGEKWEDSFVKGEGGMGWREIEEGKERGEVRSAVQFAWLMREGGGK